MTVSRTFRLFAGSAVVVMAAACGAGSGRPVGVSDGPVTAASGGDAGVDGGAVVDLPDYKKRFRKITKEPVAASGHAPGAWQLELWANESGARALVDRDAAVGSFLVVEHRPLDARDTPPIVMAMEKRPAGYAPQHGDMRYVVVDRRGALVSDGATEGCWGCHDDAPLDHIFPLAGGRGADVGDGGASEQGDASEPPADDDP